MTQGGSLNERWTRRVGDRVVHSDCDEHIALVLRTLDIDERSWTDTLDCYVTHVTARSSAEQRLRGLAASFLRLAPHAAPLPVAAASTCASCGTSEMRPAVARLAAPRPLVYGRCTVCGHGQLLSTPRPDAHADASYYSRRAADGSGYFAYESEREYREDKAARLFDSLEQAGVHGRRLLEIGSGYGFTRRVAEARGMVSAGVDVNPEAARGARALYGLATHVVTLGEALASGALAAASWDLVLYQFVLEHVSEPRAELVQAARALSPGGHLVLIVPSMAALELDIFGAAYRSLRGDHLHLFSDASLRRMLADAGFRVHSVTSHCGLHLLRGFLEPTELEAIYTSGRGPDLTVIAERIRA